MCIEGLRFKFTQCGSRRKCIRNSRLLGTIHTDASSAFLLRQGKFNEVSRFFWAVPIKTLYVTVNFTEFWVKQPSFNVCVQYQYSHKFYSRECSEQEIHNSVKAGIIQKLCYLMERSDINFLGTAPSSGAASKPLQITILFMLPPGSWVQQFGAGICRQHRAASSCVSSLGWLGEERQEPHQTLLWSRAPRELHHSPPPVLGMLKG